MKRIKNLTLGVIGATILSLGLYACSNDDATTNNNTPTEQTTLSAKLISNSEIMNYDYEKIGIVHNQGLEYVYNVLLEKGPIDANSYVMSHSQDFLVESIGSFLNGTTFASNPDNASIIAKYTLNNTDFLSLDKRKDFISKIYEYKNDLGSEALNVSNEIDNQIDTFTFGSSSIGEYESALRSKITKLNNLLERQEISQTEYAVLRAKLSIAIHSGQYWNTNIVKWGNLTTSENKPTSWFGRWWRKAAKIDAEGAAEGWKNSDKQGGDRAGDALDSGIASSGAAAFVMLIDLSGGVDSTN